MTQRSKILRQEVLVYDATSDDLDSAEPVHQIFC